MNLPQAEACVLASVIDSGNGYKLPTAVAGLINNAPESFDDARLGQVAVAIRELRLSHAPLHSAAIADRLKFEGASLFVMELMQSALSIELAEYEADPVWKGFRSRKAKTTMTEAVAAMESSPEDQQESILRHTLSTLESIKEKNRDGLPAIIDGATLMDTTPILPDMLIEGILHAGSKCSLGGGSKTFKSWTFLNMALSVSTGQPWLGCPTVRARVLYLNFEIQPAFIHHRLKVLCAARNLRPEPGYLDIWNLRGFSAPHTIIIPKIIERARESGYGLDILDPSYKLFGAGSEENKANDVAEMLNSFERIATQTGAAVAYAAHFAKGNAAAKESIDRVSGSGVFARDPDTILTFTRHESDDCFTVEVTARNLPPLPAFVVKWNYPQFTREPDLNPEDLKKRPGRPKTFSDTDTLALLEPASLTSGNWQKLAFSKLGLSRGVFFSILKRLSDNGLAIKSKINDRWTVVSKA